MLVNISPVFFMSRWN